MKIQLDAKALRNLIEADPEFEAEIKKSVICQVLKTWTFKAVESTISDMRGSISKVASERATEAAKEVYAREGLSWNADWKLTATARATIDTEAKRRIQEAFNDTYERAFNEAVGTIMGRLDINGKTLAERLEDRIERRIGATLDKEINDKVKTRIKLILSGAQDLIPE